VTRRSGQPGKPLPPDHYRLMLRAAKPYVRRLLCFLRFSGARPGEMAAVTWPTIDLERRVVVLEKHKTARTQRVPRPRVIALHHTAFRLLLWLYRHRLPGQEHAFLNARGRPWTRYAMACLLKRLRKNGGVPKGCKFYGLRHAFGTQGVLNGVDLKTLAELMGHSNTRTTEYYVHIAGNTEHLGEAVRSVMGGGKSKVHKHP
jgi:integrase